MDFSLSAKPKNADFQKCILVQLPNPNLGFPKMDFSPSTKPKKSDFQKLDLSPTAKPKF